jgi:hypothetical protein
MRFRDLLSFALALLLSVGAAACDSGADASPQAAGTDVPASSTALAPKGANAWSPPGATAVSGGQSAALPTGSYCWSAPGGVARCVDAIGPVTKTRALSVNAGATVMVGLAQGASQPKSAAVTAWSGLSARPTQGDEEVWLIGGGSSQQLSAQVTQTGVQFAAPSAPGQYVLDVALTFPEGDVSYGLLLQVQ